MFRSTRCSTALLVILGISASGCTQGSPTEPRHAPARQEPSPSGTVVRPGAPLPGADSSGSIRTAPVTRPVIDGARNLCDPTMPWYIC
jgi:hypothetical protein